VVFFEDGSRPTFVNSIAVGKDGTVYTLGRVKARRLINVVNALVGHGQIEIVSPPEL